MAELMKGHSYKDRAHTVTFPCIAEVKYDEVRLHVKFNRCPIGPSGDRVEYLTYSGKPAYNMAHFTPMFLEFFRNQPQESYELDMGVEVNGNFNDSVRWVKSSTGIPKYKLDKKTGKEHPALDVGMVRFYLFDLPRRRERYVDSEDHFLGRIALRWEVACTLSGAGLPVEIPKWGVVGSPEQLIHEFQRVRELGFEGLMVKSFDHTYQRGKRIDGWLKMKPEEEGDGVITGFSEAISEDGVPLGRAGSMHLTLEDGSKASPHGIPHDLGADMWENPEKYIGQWWTFNYMERDRAGGYRHPTVGRRREEKV